MRIERQAGVVPLVMYVELLDTASGEAASELAEENFRNSSELLEGQEHVAVKVNIEIVQGIESEDEVTRLHGGWHVSLRRNSESTDIQATGDNTPWAEGYLPLEGEGWLFFKVRADTQYCLYASPYLEITGDIPGGAYFTLVTE